MLAPVLYKPLFVFAVFLTNAPLDTVILALSDTAIAVASPTTTWAFGPIVTVAPDGFAGPVPMVVVHGDGAVVSQVVVLPALVQFASAESGKQAMTAETAIVVAGSGNPRRRRKLTATALAGHVLT
ncbi:hypothetical protein PQQ99_18535 [Paraburkholderia sediminicola]|uniref:Secreted protein n=1 Tax=Paraburkholderia metrosideri TaxID=580937 RepID=A0ABW9E1D6_9BURK